MKFGLIWIVIHLIHFRYLAVAAGAPVPLAARRAERRGMKALIIERKNKELERCMGRSSLSDFNFFLQCTTANGVRMLL
jgi:hypothetical protein